MYEGLCDVLCSSIAVSLSCVHGVFQPVIDKTCFKFIPPLKKYVAQKNDWVLVMGDRLNGKNVSGNEIFINIYCRSTPSSTPIFFGGITTSSTRFFFGGGLKRTGFSNESAWTNEMLSAIENFL